MSRYLYLILFAAVLVAPFVMRLTVAPPGSSALNDRAADRRLVVITPHNQDIRRTFERAFGQWHAKKYGQTVAVDFRSPGGTNDIKRQLDTTYRRSRDVGTGKLPAPEQVAAEIDVVWGGGDHFFESDLNRDLGLLQPMALDPQLFAAAFPKPTLGGVKLYEQGKDAAGRPAPKWVGTALSAFGIVYNPDLFRTLNLPPPKTWADLTHPKLAGLLALADPTHSGSAGVAYLMVIQREMATAEEQFLAALPQGSDGKPPALTKEVKASPAYQQAIGQGWRRGMGVLLLMAANARYFTDSAPLVPNDVGNGEAAAGVCIDFYGRVYQESVGPDRCTYVSPANATAVTPDPIAILYGVRGQRLETATRFVEFMLTKEGQRLWILKPGQPDGPVERPLRRTSVRADLYAPGTDFSGYSDPGNPFAEASSFNQRGEWMGLFTQTRSIWAAAWIDGREALQDAHARVLALPDPQKRDALLGELSDLPIKMADIEALTKQSKAIAPARLDEWRAARRIEWAGRFRAHYRGVGERASRN